MAKVSEFQSMLLVAMPQLGDPNFFHSVVFLIHHDSQGAIGLVVNRPLPLTLGEFSKGQKLACHENIQNHIVFGGGPVETEVGWILHQDYSCAERQEIRPGILVSRSQQTLTHLLSEGVQPFRLMLGYAGWGEGQLEKELKEGQWITTEVDPKYLFETNPEETWLRVLQDMGVDPNRLAMGGGLH